MSYSKDKRSRRRFINSIKSKKQLKIFMSRSNKYRTKEDFEHIVKQRNKFIKKHAFACSCFMCGNPRKHFNLRTIKEQSFDEIEDILNRG